MAGEGRLGYAINKNVGFNPGLNLTKAVPFNTRDQHWRQDQRGSMLNEVTNYFRDPISHNESVRQGSMQ